MFVLRSDNICSRNVGGKLGHLDKFKYQLGHSKNGLLRKWTKRIFSSTNLNNLNILNINRDIIKMDYRGNGLNGNSKGCLFPAFQGTLRKPSDLFTYWKWSTNVLPF